MISTKSQTIEGQLSVGRSLSVGGNATVQGGATINHDLSVKGRVIARDIQGNNKGLYDSVESLKAMHPKPLPGWYAYVEQEPEPVEQEDTEQGEEQEQEALAPKLVFMVYVVVNGAWVPSHTSSLLDYVDLVAYKERLDRLESQHADDIDRLDGKLDTEIDDREAAITAEEQARTNADNALNTAIATEAGTREQADNTLDGKISAETTARLGDVLQLNNSLTEEARERKDADIEIHDILTNIGKSVWPLQGEMVLSSQLLEYTATSHSIEVYRVLKRNNSPISNEDIESLRITKEYEEELSVIEDEPNPTNTRSVFGNVLNYGTHTFVMEARALGMEVQVSKSVVLELPMYFGFSSATNANDLNIRSLQKQAIKTSPNGNYTLINDTKGNHLWLCVPYRMSIAKVTSSGFEVPMQMVQEGSTPLGDYKCYRSASESGINRGNIKITIS